MHRPLVLTTDPALLDELLRLAAAAGAEPVVADHPAAVRSLWRDAPFVVMGREHVLALDSPALPRRPGVVIIGAAMDDHTLWQQAMERGAEHVVFLPDAEGWLVDRFADSVAAVPRGLVVAVVGACGGAGATSFAIALALAAARARRRTILADVDPYGGGIDLALGVEHVGGPRWDAFLHGQRPLAGEALAAALPRFGEVTVLAWPRQATPHVPPDRVSSMLATCRRGADLVVVDVPRWFDETCRVAFDAADLAFVVCPAEVRAIAAGRRVTESLSMLVDDVRCVVRGRAFSDITAELAAATLEVPLAGWLDSDKDLQRALDEGRPPGSRGRGHLARFCNDLVAQLPGPGEAS
jgi:secretion/DNA translocation related CpaE-like protein